MQVGTPHAPSRAPAWRGANLDEVAGPVLILSPNTLNPKHYAQDPTDLRPKPWEEGRTDLEEVAGAVLRPALIVHLVTQPRVLAHAIHLVYEMGRGPIDQDRHALPRSLFPSRPQAVRIVPLGKKDACASPLPRRRRRARVRVQAPVSVIL